MKYKLLVSSGSLEELHKAVIDFFYGSLISFQPISKDLWEVHNRNGKIEGYTVYKKENRYRFEEVHS